MASGSRFLGCGARREGEHAVAHDGHAVTLTWMAGLSGGEGSIIVCGLDVGVEDTCEEVDMLGCDWLYARILASFTHICTTPSARKVVGRATCSFVFLRISIRGRRDVWQSVE